MMRDLVISVRSTVVLWILTAALYPLLILGIGQVAFPVQANGSLLTNAQGQVVGSALIGQTFQGNSYFWGRPSAINYSEGEKAAPTGISGASNFAPGNLDLLKRIEAEIQRLKAAGVAPTGDLVYSSGSGLDPQISVAAAQAQIQRIAKDRGLTSDGLETLIAQHTEPRFLGIFGEPGVNVLQLNLALDQRPQ
ncbi:potassium-transporting ATPase subunit C [Gloeomargarita lithophora Alchichica-D10]|uniref:Potassium-transporting ATPase KdpC subunit n=1 Tax=Gloeomargarita lithophora Alchichica-D10 TaxID=1188229 RepID=A0A1J0AEI8_9CYAN|nr:K(+)-transporting ATPase subunit C [Gloeomargarita lithophora]APB34358.1 potassium-transporting ATPase subunit C [Gloeomargarita lithophora Alchichica-D10]